jgi:hypothetical protein
MIAKAIGPQKTVGAIGIMPSTVDMAVSMIGRNRALLASIEACRTLLPASLSASTSVIGALAELGRRGFQWANRSVLLAESLGYSFSYEPLASLTARTRAMGGAPIPKCVRIDGNTHDDVPVCLESTLHFLGNLQPLRPGAWHPVAVGKMLSSAG